MPLLSIEEPFEPDLESDEYFDHIRRTFIFGCLPSFYNFALFSTHMERSALVKANLWTCAVTGKQQLTLEEALQSEKVSRFTFNRISVT